MRKGIISETLDFQVVCNVVSYGWDFGLVQASLELLTLCVPFSICFYHSLGRRNVETLGTRGL